jgi:hypothetical protein
VLKRKEDYYGAKQLEGEIDTSERGLK